MNENLNNIKIELLEKQIENLKFEFSNDIKSIKNKINQTYDKLNEQNNIFIEKENTKKWYIEFKPLIYIITNFITIILLILLINNISILEKHYIINMIVIVFLFLSQILYLTNKDKL